MLYDEVIQGGDDGCLREKPPLLPGARFVSCPAVSYQRREAGSGLSHAIISLERCTSGGGSVTSGTPIETAEYLRASSEEFHRGPGRRRSLGSDAASRSSYDDAELVVPRRFRDHDVGNRAVHREESLRTSQSLSPDVRVVKLTD